MGKIHFKGNASGTGVITLTAPNTDSDRTVTMPPIDGEMLTTNSLLTDKLATLLSVTGSAPIYPARAWANYDGVNDTIRGFGNVSSIIDYGVGMYRVNFATAMDDENYCSVISGTGASTSSGHCSFDSQSFGGSGDNHGTAYWFNIRGVNKATNSYDDHPLVCVAVYA